MVINVCSEPVQCVKPCNNGGECVGLNRCRCSTGFAGDLCETGLCVFSVQTDLHLDLCLCDLFLWCYVRWPGFSTILNMPGKHFIVHVVCVCVCISLAVTIPCVPLCQHGGTCSPHNTCTCPEGTSGLRCEKLWVPLALQYTIIANYNLPVSGLSIHVLWSLGLQGHSRTFRDLSWNHFRIGSLLRGAALSQFKVVCSGAGFFLRTSRQLFSIHLFLYCLVKRIPPIAGLDKAGFHQTQHLKSSAQNAPFHIS